MPLRGMYGFSAFGDFSTATGSSACAERCVSTEHVNNNKRPPSKIERAIGAMNRSLQGVLRASCHMIAANFQPRDARVLSAGPRGWSSEVFKRVHNATLQE